MRYEKKDTTLDANSIQRQYRHLVKRNILILIVFILILFLFTVISVNISDAPMSFQESFLGIFGLADPKINYIVWHINMRRVCSSVVAGAGLAIAGLIMQTCLKNDLASPSTIGVSSAATFGANIAIIGFGAGLFNNNGKDAVTIINPYLTGVCAFICSLIAIVLIVAIAKMQKYSTEAIILAGAALSALFGAGTTMLQYFADEQSLANAVFWTFGNVGRATWTEVLIMAIITFVCLIYFITQSWNYNALRSGDDSAKSLGVNVKLTRILGLVLAALLTSIIVSFIGLIGFIGLIAPQIVKRIIGTDHRFYIPGTILMGSIILMVADTLSRGILIPGHEVPVGAITAILGAPVFILVLMKKVRKQ